MRIPLATSIRTRTGAPSSKDARLVNSYVEVKGEQSVVRKRPIAQGGVVVGTGTAQGGIGFTMGGTDYIYTLNGDTGALDTLATAGTTWSGATSYSIGDNVSIDFVDYWALADNTASQPPSGNWSTSYVPAVAGLYSVTNKQLSYNGSVNLTFSNGGGSYLNPTVINSVLFSNNHSSATFAGLISDIVADCLSTTPTITGEYAGELDDGGLVAVTGTWSASLDLSGSYWDENPLFEIDGALQNVISTSCTRLDLCPNGTVIGDIGNQGQDSAWEGEFATHP